MSVDPVRTIEGRTKATWLRSVRLLLPLGITSRMVLIHLCEELRAGDHRSLILNLEFAHTKTLPHPASSLRSLTFAIMTLGGRSCLKLHLIPLPTAGGPSTRPGAGCAVAGLVLMPQKNESKNLRRRPKSSERASLNSRRWSKQSVNRERIEVSDSG